MSCRQHGYPWPSLATSPYRSSPPADLQGYITYPHIAAVCVFALVVLLLLGYMWRSIGVHHLWARPAVSCMSSSSNLDSFRDGRQVAVQLVPCGVLPPGLVQYWTQEFMLSPRGISPKVNVKAQLEFELAYLKASLVWLENNKNLKCHINILQQNIQRFIRTIELLRILSVVKTFR